MDNYSFKCFAATGRWGEEGSGREERRGEADTTAVPAAVCLLSWWTQCQIHAGELTGYVSQSYYIRHRML